MPEESLALIIIKKTKSRKNNTLTMNLFMPLEQSNKNKLDNQINKLAAERGGKLIKPTTKPKIFFKKKSASASRSIITKNQSVIPTFLK
ncbi:hypothetical protein Hanom_Chr04g00380901 [Helianthus anomalus]